MMPVRKSGDKWTFGGGKYDTKAAADRSYNAYLAKKHSQKFAHGGVVRGDGRCIRGKTKGRMV